MQDLPTEKLRKIKRLADLTIGKEVAIATEFNKIDTRFDKVDSKIEAIRTQIPDVKKALDRVEALVDGEKGEDGDDYILTKEDKVEIAGLIKVPIVEKIIERREVIKEKPVVTKEITKEIVKEIREVKVDVPYIDNASIGFLEDKIDSLEDKIEEKIKSLPTKSQLPHAVGIVVREVQAGTGVTVDNSNPLKPIINASGGADWTYYATKWDVAPSINASITGGTVYDYTLDGVTRYRFVPTTYSPSTDAFYTTFVNPTLSGLITTRDS